jgi:hypothetical protein
VRTVIRHIGWLATVGITVAALAWCSSSKSSTGAAADYASKGTIDVALVSDFTGPLAPSTGVDGALAYFDEVNAEGGVDGYKIQD